MVTTRRRNYKIQKNDGKKVEEATKQIKKVGKEKSRRKMEGGNVKSPKPRLAATNEVCDKIKQYKDGQPSIFAWEIRDRLKQDQVCTEETLPSVNSLPSIIDGEKRSVRKYIKRVRKKKQYAFYNSDLSFK